MPVAVAAREAAVGERDGEDFRQMAHRLLDELIDGLDASKPEAGGSLLAAMSHELQKKRLDLVSACLQAKIEERFADLLHQEQAPCPKCSRVRSRMRFDSKVRSTLQGQFTLERPYFYCRPCGVGFHPIDGVLGLSEDEHQYDVAEEVIRLGADLPFERSTEHFKRLTGVSVSAHLAHDKLGEVGEHATLAQVIPSAEEIERRIDEVARGRRARPVLVVAVDGAASPVRPPGGRGEKRGAGFFREIKGVRVYLLGNDRRFVDVASWHQIGDVESFARDLREIRERLPLKKVRVALVADGAQWIWDLLEEVFPKATSVLDYYHCAEHVFDAAHAQFGESVEALQWAEFSLALLALGCAHSVALLWQQLDPLNSNAAKTIRNFTAYLDNQRSRIHFRSNRRRGIPNGSGAIESANKFLCHARLKVSGAWWLEEKSNAMLRIRCAIHNGTFDSLFRRFIQSRARQ
ncbi:MAG: ISKra4 family transposase [Burkholderiales bacterium]|nr:ISKra4 family transposase [Burkholderiales bacterium]